MAHGIAALMERIEEYGAERVESVARQFADNMRRAAVAVGSAEALDVAEAVERELAAEGSDGLVDLILAGPALNGLGERDTERLLALVDERCAVARDAVAA